MRPLLSLIFLLGFCLPSGAVTITEPLIPITIVSTTGPGARTENYIQLAIACSLRLSTPEDCVNALPAQLILGAIYSMLFLPSGVDAITGAAVSVPSAPVMEVTLSPYVQNQPTPSGFTPSAGAAASVASPSNAGATVAGLAVLPNQPIPNVITSSTGKWTISSSTYPAASYTYQSSCQAYATSAYGLSGYAQPGNVCLICSAGYSGSSCTSHYQTFISENFSCVGGTVAPNGVDCLSANTSSTYPIYLNSACTFVHDTSSPAPVPVGSSVSISGSTLVVNSPDASSMQVSALTCDGNGQMTSGIISFTVPNRGGVGTTVTTLYMGSCADGAGGSACVVDAATTTGTSVTPVSVSSVTTSCTMGTSCVTSGVGTTTSLATSGGITVTGGGGSGTCGGVGGVACDSTLQSILGQFTDNQSAVPIAISGVVYTAGSGINAFNATASGVEGVLAGLGGSADFAASTSTFGQAWSYFFPVSAGGTDSTNCHSMLDAFGVSAGTTLLHGEVVPDICANPTMLSIPVVLDWLIGLLCLVSVFMLFYDDKVVD